MSHWSGEMEFEFVEGDSGGSFVTTDKVLNFIRTHLARGEVQDAMRLYESAAAGTAEELLRDAQSSSSTSQKNLAEMFALARDFGNAARVFELARLYDAAARYYEQGSEFESAARCYQQLGDGMRAAAALERAGRSDQALQLYQQGGPTEAQAECLLRQQRFWQAATIYRQLGNVRAEVEMLRLVPLESPHRVQAVEQLADLLERYGRMDQAVQLIVDTVRQVPVAQQHGPLFERLVRLFEGLGRPDQAQMVRTRFQQQLAGAAHVAQKALPVQAVDPRRPAAPSGTDVLAAADPFASLVDPFERRADAGAAPVDAYAHLKAIPIFGELGLSDMKDLYRISQEVGFQAGATVIEQDVRGPGLTVLLQGQLKVLRVDGGQARELATLAPGAYVGEMSLVDDAPTSARVVAGDGVKALYISRERFEQYLYGHETAAARIFRLFTRTLAERLRQSNRR